MDGTSVALGLDDFKWSSCFELKLQISFSFIGKDKLLNTAGSAMQIRNGPILHFDMLLSIKL